MKSVASSLLFALAAAPSLLAQTPVTLRCELADGRQTGCYYCPGYEFVVKFVGTQLESPNVNLNQFTNQYVLIHGTWDGTKVTVTTAQAAVSSFSLTGNGSIGNRFRPNTQANPGDMAMNVVALGSGFTVPFLDLALLLSPATAVVQGMGPVNGNGEFKTDLDIPNDPSLVGLRIYGQGVVMTPVGLIYTTDIDAREIAP